MIERLIPRRFKRFLADRITRLIGSEFLYSIPFLPYQSDSSSYILDNVQNRDSKEKLPVPPQEHWVGYGPTKEDYLRSGETDVRNLRQSLEAASRPITPGQAILEFGCAGGRMIRWLEDLASTCEIWGTDIHVGRVVWCRQNLCPPFHFTSCTVYPHLPFEDRYFDVIFAGSVFTHIDDLADAWFLELRRILQPEGMLYITIHDAHTIELLATEYREHRFARKISAESKYQEYSQSDFAMFTFGRAFRADVFYGVEYLQRMLHNQYQIVSVNHSSYGYQTGVLLKRI